jgi:hypothetical protein
LPTEKRNFPNVFHEITEELYRGPAGHWDSWGGSVKLFSRLFTKAPAPPPSLQERITTLNAGTPDLILETALCAGEEGMRVAAIQKLRDGPDLRRLAGLSGLAPNPSITFPPRLQQAAQGRLAQLIDDGSIDFDGFCAQAQNRSVMFSVVAQCKDASRLPDALASIDDPIQMAQLVVDSPSSRLRQLAAQAIDDGMQLRQLLKQVRGKDKNVYKILKQKCDALNAEDRKAAQIASEVSALCASLERHSHRTYDALYGSVFGHLRTRWRALTPRPAGDIEQRGEQSIDRCNDVIEEHQRLVAQQAALQAAQQAAREARERDHQAAQEEASAQADAEAQRRNELAAAREAEETARAEKQAAEEHVFHQIGGLIRKANGALSDGNTQQAAGLRRAIEEKWPPVAAVPTHLTRQ